MEKEARPEAGKAGGKVSFVQITVAYGHNVAELYGLTKEGEVFKSQWGPSGQPLGWAPLSMVRAPR